MAEKKRSGWFFLRLAWHNVRHNKRTCLPHLIATAVIFGAFLLMCGLVFSTTLNNLPDGGTAIAIFSSGMLVFSIFAVFFMLYINNSLIGERKKEFGLYGVLGLEKRHIVRVLLWENAIVLGGGLLIGCALSLVFGQLIFWILMRVIRSVPGSTFSLAPKAFLHTLELFAVTFVFTALSNMRKVHKCSAMALMKAEKRGEKDSVLIWPLAFVGLVMLIGSYYLAWVIEDAGFAMLIFFTLAALVIVATFILCSAGSVALLRLLKRNKRFYYKVQHFITVSGLMQRMKQNARSLATICILSTMLVVTVSGTLSLYLEQENMLRANYPFDVCVNAELETDEEVRAFEQTLLDLAKKHNVTLSADGDKLITPDENPYYTERFNVVHPEYRRVELQTLLFNGNDYVFDAAGETDDCIAFVNDIMPAYQQQFGTERYKWVSNIFTTRLEQYSLYGGLLFLGVFFGLLFLTVMVLIIYFKQVTEGYADRERFVILQKVGMDDALVRGTINRQVLWVFFIPLGMTSLHMLFASRIMARMLQTLMLYDWQTVVACVLGTLAVFAIIYLVIYRLTARVYYRIVKW